MFALAHPGFAHVKRGSLLCRCVLSAWAARRASVMLGVAVMLARMRRLGCRTWQREHGQRMPVACCRVRMWAAVGCAEAPRLVCVAGESAG